MKQVTRRAATEADESPLPVIRLAHAEPFETFYVRELARLTTYARALCGDAVADDVAQEAMLAAYRRWADVSTYDKPEAWVRHVCGNVATSVLRRRAVEGRALLRLSARRTLPPLEDDDERFWSAIRALPRRQAQAAALRYVYDLSVVDIAATLGCSEGSAKVHLSRGRASLSARLSLEEEDLS